MDKNGVIEVKNLTKDYGDKRGVFNVSFKIEKGEMLGFVGTNGSGKTTTIRNIMGFIKPTSGHCYVNGLDTWKYPSEVAKHIGYVPGEIAFPDNIYGVRKRCNDFKWLVRANLKDIRLFVTLTYKENMTDTKRLYRDFKAFFMRLRRAYPFLKEYFVAFEPQERGSWHAHMILL